MTYNQCDIIGCSQEAKYFFFNGLLKVCKTHKYYPKKCNLFDLRLNCGRRKKHGCKVKGIIDEIV
jgi:hypothetical protein